MPQQQRTPAPWKGGRGSGSAQRAGERSREYDLRKSAARLTLRTLFNDDGHFLGLEVVHG